MIMMTTPSLVVLLVTALYSIQPAAEAANVCLGDSVPEGRQSEVTCIFDEDLKQDRLDYQILKFPLNSTSLYNTNGTEVLHCSWRQANIPDCMAKNGYEHTMKSGGCDCQVSLQISSLTRDQEGIYKCQLVTQNDVPSKPCTVQIYTPEGTGKDPEPLHPVISALGPVGILAIVLVVSLLCVVCTLIAVLNWRKYKKHNKKHAQEERDLHATIQEIDDKLRQFRIEKETAEQYTETMLETKERSMNTDRVPMRDIGSNTDPKITSALNVGSSRLLASNASLASTRSQQGNPRNRQFQGSVPESLYNPPTVMHQPGFDETEEDMDVNRGLLHQDGDRMQYTQGSG